MADEATTLRRCIGSAKFGIGPHEAPADEFPTQPSQKDGLGRMCKAHWNQYTTALRKAALARNAADGGLATEVAPTESNQAPVTTPTAVGDKTAKSARAARPEPIRTRAARRQQDAPADAGSQGDAG